jgi:hypothetical protein
MHVPYISPHLRNCGYMNVLPCHTGRNTGNTNMSEKSKHNYWWLTTRNCQYLIIVHHLINECQLLYFADESFVHLNCITNPKPQNTLHLNQSKAQRFINISDKQLILTEKFEHFKIHRYMSFKNFIPK